MRMIEIFHSVIFIQIIQRLSAKSQNELIQMHMKSKPLIHIFNHSALRLQIRFLKIYLPYLENEPIQNNKKSNLFW